MDIIEAAENVIGNYTWQQLNQARRRQEVCGCRACVARAVAWADWAAGNDGNRYQARTVPAQAAYRPA
jgi:hypothetical protein